MTITTGPPAAQATLPAEATGRSSSGLRRRLARCGRWVAGRRGRLTGPVAALLIVLLTALGALVDQVRGNPLGVGFASTFWVASVLVALTVRPRSLVTAAALPPVVFAGMVALVVKLGGETQGTRELGLDVVTTLALSAPVIFAGTAAAAAIVLVRAVALLRLRAHPAPTT